MMLWIAVMIVLVLSMSPLAMAEAGEVNRLRVEWQDSPLAIGVTQPRLSWELQSSKQNVMQKAYQIRVASTRESLEQADIWDSGRVESSDMSGIAYAGTPLKSRQHCHWQVGVWLSDDSVVWSEPATWEMDLMNASDWQGKWVEANRTPSDFVIHSARYEAVDGSQGIDLKEITLKRLAKGDGVSSNNYFYGDVAPGKLKHLPIDYSIDGERESEDIPEGRSMMLPTERQPLLRRKFALDKPIKSARLYASALGVYELSLNGKRVGEDWLAPGWTDYRRRLKTQTYDVTALLQAGDNALGAQLSGGWYSGRAGLFEIVRWYGTTPALLAQLEVTFADGSMQIITSDDQWLTTPGPIQISDLMQGERFDARKAVADWNTIACDESRWTKAKTRDEWRLLESDICPPIRTFARLSAKAITEPKPGRFVFDLQQNMVGVAELRVTAPAGTRIQLRHAEMLNPDGTIYEMNLRMAGAVDTYVCRGGGEEVWHPQFTFHGFRYVEVTGLTQKPTLSTITGIAFSSDTPIAGEFECSDSRLNQLHSNIRWGLRGNYVSIPTDCPQRDERMGWTADTQVFVPTAAYHADVANFLGKWMDDLTDAQRADGAHADVAPITQGFKFGAPVWADAGTVVPMALYTIYGDRRLLEHNVDSMRRWVDWCTAHSTNGIRDHSRGADYGDWLSIGADTNKELIGTAYYAHSADLLSQAYRSLGDEAKAAKYASLFETVRAAFNAKYVSATEPKATEFIIEGDTQCAYVLALRFNLLTTDAMKKQALDRLCADIKAKGNHLSTGFVGVSHLLHVLRDNGRDDVAQTLLTQETFPSWLFSVKHGATTIWERWDGWTPEKGFQHPGMNSFNHYALGSCGSYMMEGVVGIAQLPGSVGFEHLRIAPAPGNLTFARGSYHSVRGLIRSDWNVVGDRFTLEVTIPPNTKATIVLPDRQEHVVGSGTYRFESAVR